MAKILNLRQHLQTIRKGSHSVSDFVLKIKNIGDALSAAGEEVSERDLLLSLMHRVGHEYDAVVVLISSQRMTMSLEEAQFLLLMHEQRIEQLNSPNNFGGISANFVTNNVGDKRDHRGGSNYNRGYCCLHHSGRVYITRHAEFNELDFPYQQLFLSAPGSAYSTPTSNVPIHTIVDMVTSNHLQPNGSSSSQKDSTALPSVSASCPATSPTAVSTCLPTVSSNVVPTHPMHPPDPIRPDRSGKRHSDFHNFSKTSFYVLKSA
ncbi:hypothetical protein ACOSQ3_025040 [Xanthoceras sorbifolium]